MGYGFPESTVYVCHSYCDSDINLYDILVKIELSKEIVNGYFEMFSKIHNEIAVTEFFYG